MGEPSLSEVHADLVGRLKHDERLRAVEQEQAAMRAAISELPRMEDRLMAAITDIKVATAPKPIWPAVSSLAAVMIVLMGVFALIYSR